MLLRGKRIFIVEDNSGNLAIASIYLKQHGATVDFSRWGHSAFERIMKALPIDVILMDLMLPQNISGFDIFKQFRAVPELKNVPIVAVSAADPDIAVPRALEMGFSGFIAKPITPLISKQIADVIAGKDVWAADTSY